MKFCCLEITHIPDELFVLAFESVIGDLVVHCPSVMQLNFQLFTSMHTQIINDVSLERSGKSCSNEVGRDSASSFVAVADIVIHGWPICLLELAGAGTVAIWRGCTIVDQDSTLLVPNSKYIRGTDTVRPQAIILKISTALLQIWVSEILGLPDCRFSKLSSMSICWRMHKFRS